MRRQWGSFSRPTTTLGRWFASKLRSRKVCNGVTFTPLETASITIKLPPSFFATIPTCEKFAPPNPVVTFSMASQRAPQSRSWKSKSPGWSAKLLSFLKSVWLHPKTAALIESSNNVHLIERITSPAVVIYRSIILTGTSVTLPSFMRKPLMAGQLESCKETIT